MVSTTVLAGVVAEPLITYTTPSSAGLLAGDEDVAGVGAGGADRNVARPGARP